MLQRALLGLGVLNLLFLIVLSYAFFRDKKVVYVDSAKLMNGYQGMLDARKAFQNKSAGWKANIDTLASQVQRQIVAYEKENTGMTVRERQLSQELIRTKQKQFTDYQQAIDAQAQQEDDKMTGEVVGQINAYLKKFGESQGYNIILAATEYGNIAFADDGLDITQDVLEGLNREYGGE